MWVITKYILRYPVRRRVQDSRKCHSSYQKVLHIERIWFEIGFTVCYKKNQKWIIRQIFFLENYIQAHFILSSYKKSHLFTILEFHKLTFTNSSNLECLFILSALIGDSLDSEKNSMCLISIITKFYLSHFISRWTLILN